MSWIKRTAVNLMRKRCRIKRMVSKQIINQRTKRKIILLKFCDFLVKGKRKKFAEVRG